MNSLKEQLLKAGLVTEQEVKQAGHQKRVEKKKTTPAEQERQAREAREEIKRQTVDQREEDRKLNVQAQSEQEEKSQRIQREKSQKELLKSLFSEGGVPNWEGNRQYYFEDGQAVEFIRVSDTVSRQLEEGRAAIARAPGGNRGYTILKAHAAKQLREAAPEYLIAFHD